MEAGMTIQLRPEQEQIIGRAIQAGLIRGAEEVLDAGVETIRRRLEERRGAGAPGDAAQWSRELRAWVQSHSTSTPLLSDEAISRDSIYGMRGM
jgi:hypothetical protein